MPLYALDSMGRLYQTGGLAENDMSVGRYADNDLGEQNNLYFGDLSGREARRMASHRAKKLAQWKKHQAKLKKARQAAQQKAQAQAARKRQANKIVAAQKTRARKRHQARYLQAYRDGLNPMGAIESQLLGNPLAGFEDEGEAIMSPSQMMGAQLADDVYFANEFGQDMAMGFSLKKAFKKVTKAVKKVVPKAVVKATKDVGKVAGKVIEKTNPVTITARIAKQIPLVKDVYKGVNKISGGLLTSVENISKLPAKAVSGQKITKAEFMEAAMMALKVGAIVATGGGAVAIISAAAGQMKGGPLGKTSFGRAILSVAEIASVSALGKQTLSKVLEKKAQDMIVAKAASEAGKKAGVLGSIVVGAAASAGFEGLKAPPAGGVLKADANVVNTVAKNSNKVAEQAQKGFLDKVKSGELKFDTQAAMKKAQDQVVAASKKELAKEFEKKTGIPFDIAQRAAKGEVPTVDELKQKVKDKVARGLDEAKEDLTKIASQMTNADATMKSILEKKAELLDKEIKKKVAEVEAIKEDGAKQLLAANNDLVNKLQAANAQRDYTAKLAAELKTLTDEFERAGSSNIDVKNSLWPKIQALQAKLNQENAKFDKMADIAWDASDKAKQMEDFQAVRVLKAEVAPYGSESKRYFDHPLLSYT